MTSIFAAGSLGLLLLTLPTHAADGVYARAGLNVQNAATYAGRTTMLSAGYRRAHAYTLGLNADLTQRRYNGGVRIVDDQYYLAGSRTLSEHWYVDGSTGTAATADIFARWSAAITPHYVINKNDFGLGLRYAEYRTGRTGALNASYLHYFANGLTVGGGAFIVRAATSIASYQLTSIYAPGERHLFRVTGAAGRTLEDRGLEANFNSLSTEYSYTCAAGWMAGVALTDYWSQVRREHVVGLRLGWR